MQISWIWPVAVTVVWLASALWHFIVLLQYFQLHEYQEVRFARWAVKNWSRVIWPVQLLLVPVLVISSLLFDLSRAGVIVMALVGVWLAANGVTFWRDKKGQNQAIKPLVYTQRVKRLLAGGLLLLMVEAGLAWGLVFGWPPDFSAAGETMQAGLPAYLAWLTGLEQLTFVNIILANLLLFPVEALFRSYYIGSARRKIRAMKPFVIGITGSYGKTSTKEILAHLLSAKYEVLKTPKSYNTLLGICKVIREDLRPEHQYFVVEMGAYKPGEIARLCRLVQPRIGILTAVGPQHLERFKTIDNVARAKNELIEALPSEGVAVFNADDPICLRLAGQARVQTRLYSLSSPDPPPTLRGQNVKIDANGTTFEIIHHGQPPQAVRSVLLGRHNASNILAATLAALECGLTVREIAQALAVLPPVEHRLQLMKGPFGITYIDDAYNANPAGAAMALEVLAAFEGRKFLVTPGLVELGPEEKAENERLGQAAAGVCDYVFLVGDSGGRVGHILSGLQQEDFEPSRIFVVDNLIQARHKLREIVQPGDVVLFENDLSDIY